MTSLALYLKKLQSEPADEGGLTALEAALGHKLPRELRQLFAVANGGELELAEEMIQLFPFEAIAGVDADYRISDKTPGLIPFADDGADGLFVFDTRVRPAVIFRMPFSAAGDPSQWICYGTKLLEFFRHLEAGTHDEGLAPTPPAKAAAKVPKPRPGKTGNGPGEVRKFHPMDVNQMGRGIDVCALTLSPDGTRALSQHHYNPLSHWDLASGKEISFPGPEPFWFGEVAAFAPDGWHAYLAQSGCDGRYALLDLKSGKTVIESRVTEDPRIHGLCPHPSAPYQSRLHELELSPDGMYLYSSSATITLLLDAASLKLRHQFPGGLNRGQKAAFSRNESLMVVGYVDFQGYDQSGYARGVKQEFLRLFSPETGECVRTFPMVLPVGDLSLASDGRLALAQGSQVTLMDIQTGTVKKEIPVKVDGVATCRFTPDDARLLIGTPAGRLLVLDSASYRVVAELKTPSRSLQHLRISADSKYVLTGGERSGMLRYWRI